jgi:hypothetical protein
MNKKALVIGGIAVAVALAGGWALAQTAGPGSRMHGDSAERMGPGMMQQRMGMGPGMMHGMGHGMGSGMMHGMGPGMMHGGGSSDLPDAVDLRELKAELGIKPAQEQAWTKYAKAVEEAAVAMTTAREGGDRNAVSKMSPADRYAYVSKRREEAQKQFEGVKTAATELLAALDETQKQAAAEVLPGAADTATDEPEHRH